MIRSFLNVIHKAESCAPLLLWRHATRSDSFDLVPDERVATGDDRIALHLS
jgi:hypothetical protein